MRGLDLSFIEQNKGNDLVEDGSYFDRPVTRSKPRRPVSRQLRLNKRVNNIKGNRAESESFRGMGELGDCDPPSLNDNMNVHLIQKVIPAEKPKKSEESVSPIKVDKGDTFMDRKRSLRDSTSLDPKLKVNKSISFNRVNLNNKNEQNTEYSSNGKNDDSQQSTLNSKNFVGGDLNKSIESVVMKGRVSLLSIHFYSGLDSNGVRVIKTKEYKN